MTPRAAYVEEVRVRALRLMEDRKWQASELAAGVLKADGSKYSDRAVQAFVAGEAEFQTTALAHAVSRAHREIGGTMPCPYCGRGEY